MLIITPFLKDEALADATSAEMDELRNLDIDQVTSFFDQMYENAAESNSYTVSVQSAKDQDGNVWEDASFSVVGSAKLGGDRHLICAGGVAVNLDITLKIFGEMREALAVA